MRRCYWCWILLILGRPVFAFGWANDQPAMSVKEAGRLVHAALRHKTRRLPGLAVVPGGEHEVEPRCAVFDVLWSNPTGSPHVDFYTVDRRTGEVWRSMVCERVTNHSLETLQRAIRRQLGVRKDEIHESMDNDSCCSSDCSAERRGVSPRRRAHPGNWKR